MKQREPQPDERESRAAVALTVAWMLSCLSTAVALFVVLGLRLLMLAFPVAAGGIHPLGRVSGVLLSVAVITGLVCVAFIPLVYRARQFAPPREITIGAAMIGLAPIVFMIVLSLL